MKKLSFASFFALAIAFLAASIFAPSASAHESSNSFKEKIKGIEFVIPYKKSDVIVKKKEDSNIGTINVYDKSKNLIDSYSVEDLNKVKSIPLKNSATGITTLSDNTTLQNVSHSRTDNGYVSTLRVRMEIYSYGSFRQINNVLSTQWFAGSGNQTLENASADSIPDGGSYPTTAIDVLGDATLQVATTEEFSAGFDEAGFSFGGSSGSTNYFRKYIELRFTYSLY